MKRQTSDDLALDILLVFTELQEGEVLLTLQERLLRPDRSVFELLFGGDIQNLFNNPCSYVNQEYEHKNKILARKTETKIS